MTIKIEIIDPHTCSKAVLTHTAKYLLALAGHDLIPVPQEPPKVTPPPVKSEPLDESREEEDKPQHELDSKGELWNEEIHVKTKKKNNDGTWRCKRKSFEDKENLKELESSEDTSIEYPTYQATAEVLTEQKDIEQIRDDIQEEIMGFPELLKKIMDMMNSEQVTHKEVLDILQPLGLSKLPDVALNPHLIPEINEQLKRFEK